MCTSLQNVKRCDFLLFWRYFQRNRTRSEDHVGRLHSCSVPLFKKLSGNINNHDICRGKRLIFFEISPYHDFGPSIGRQGEEERYFVQIPEPLISVRSSFVFLSFDWDIFEVCRFNSTTSYEVPNIAAETLWTWPKVVFKSATVYFHKKTQPKVNND